MANCCEDVYDFCEAEEGYEAAPSPTPTAGSDTSSSLEEITRKSDDEAFDNLSSMTDQMMTTEEEKELENQLSPAMASLSAFTIKSPFCCDAELVHKARESFFPPESDHPFIMEIIATANAGQVGFTTDLSSNGTLQEADIIWKVNPVVKGEEDQGSWLFARAPDGSGAKIVCISQKPTMKLNKIGEGAYLSFMCTKHKKLLYRVGVFHKKWNLKREFATFGDEKIDKILGVPTKPVVNFGY